MALLCRSRLFGLLLILASLPLDPGTALALSAAPPSAPAAPAAEAMEARLQRIATALRERQAAGEPAGAIPDNAVAWVGWANGGGGRAGWGNGGFRNGGWGNGGFRNGGWGNGGFRNGGGGWRNFRNW